MTQSENNIPMLRACPDVDLRLMAAMWDVQSLKLREMRPTDRATIRQAVTAVENLGARLIDMMGGTGVMTCRAMPRITHLTRIRKAPKRLWLEIRHADSDAALFLEFKPEDVTIGMHAPRFADDATRKDAWARFRKHKPQIFRALKQKRSAEDGQIDDSGTPPGAWSLSKRRPPVFALPGDAPAKVPGAVTISRALEADVSVAEMATDLSEAARLFAPFLEQEGREMPALLCALATLDAAPAAEGVRLS